MPLFANKPVTHVPAYSFGSLGSAIAGVILFGLMGFFVFMVLLQPGFGNFSFLWVFLTLLLFVVPWLKAWQYSRQLKKHQSALALYAQVHGRELVPGAALGSDDVVVGSVARVHNARDPRVITCIQGDDWQYSEFCYDTYQRDKYGEHKVDTVYYAIMSTQLPREVPHLFFDSVVARKRQFRFEFARSQKYSFEGDFDQSFVTYMPDDYQIDSLAIIGPEVMLALKDAAAYDIEMVGDRILLLSDLGDPETELPQMAAKLAAIKKSMVDNLANYRDDRLPYDLSKRMVSQAGEQLRGSRVWFWVGLIGPVLYILYIITRFVIAANGGR